MRKPAARKKKTTVAKASPTARKPAVKPLQPAMEMPVKQQAAMPVGLQVAKETDPVCGMKVDPALTPHQHVHQSQTYYFCSAGCKTKFSINPLKYLEPEDKPGLSAVADGAVYTCPMHQEIRQVGPGACPICGMALEPVEVTATEQPNPELADMRRRFWIGLALALPVVILEMGAHLVDLHSILAPQTSNLVQFAFATPAVLWAGWPFFVRGLQSLQTRNLNMFTLIAMGTGVAWGYSVVGTFLGFLFPAAL